mmetsp:Transcript_106967/g.297881  ORF Transcript_106967/g.297881 Transcript_106967/m.297881 type:complete len:277 (-) Transcript_106967:472-1302(-)
MPPGDISLPPATWPPANSLAFGIGTETSYMTSWVREVFWHSKHRTIETTRPWKSSEIMEAKCVDGAASSSRFSSLSAVPVGTGCEEALVLLSEGALELPVPGTLNSWAAPSDTALWPCACSAWWPVAAGLAPAELEPARGSGAAAFVGSLISSTSVTPSVLWQNCMSWRVAAAAAPGRFCPAAACPASSSPPGCWGPSAPAVPAGAPGAPPDASAECSRPKQRSRWPGRSSGTSRRSSSCKLSSTQRRNSWESCCAYPWKTGFSCWTYFRMSSGEW